MDQNKYYEFEWYIFTNDNRETPVAGLNDGEMALDFMRKLGDGAIRVNKNWLQISKFKDGNFNITSAATKIINSFK